MLEVDIEFLVDAMQLSRLAIQQSKNLEYADTGKRKCGKSHGFLCAQALIGGGEEQSC